MTTLYRNAASVAEARVLELTTQWENTLKNKGYGRGPDEDNEPKSASPTSTPARDGDSRESENESKQSNAAKQDKEPS